MSLVHLRPVEYALIYLYYLLQAIDVACIIASVMLNLTQQAGVGFRNVQTSLLGKRFVKEVLL